jgi:hypothetical protein
LLNESFIPVHVDGTYLQANQTKDNPELIAYRELMSEMHRVNKERSQAGEEALSIGTVHAYILDSTGQAVDSRHVAHAGPANVLTMLTNAAKTLNVSPGPTLVPPKNQSPQPDAPADALVLHLTARYLVPRNHERARTEIEGEWVPRKTTNLGGERSGQWDALPSEDWIVLESDQWQELIPKGNVKPGDHWQVPRTVSDILLKRFYPTTELNDLSQNKVEKSELQLTVLSATNGAVLLRIDGSLDMKHAFYPNRPDANFVDATLQGVLVFDQTTSHIEQLYLITNRASYGDANRRQEFGVAVRKM